MIKKVFRTVKTVLVWLMVTLAVSMMIFTVISVTTFNRNDRNLFGYKIYIVQTDSMAKTDFDAGALIFVKEVDPATLREGDIITFVSQGAESFGQTVTHKIRKLTADAENNPGFITYGTTTDVDDETVVTYPYILGKYERHVPHLGTFFQFLKTTPGYIVCIFIPFMMIILYEGIKCFRLFRRYKTEQMDQMQAENAKILEQLRMLEAQLAQQQAAEQASAEADRWPADAV
ncbi:MAG: signal peptidase I [Ruminococcaceae bacterium]|nr:signal peptidase I [Oscillospiraceae bacterium]